MDNSSRLFSIALPYVLTFDISFTILFLLYANVFLLRSFPDFTFLPMLVSVCLTFFLNLLSLCLIFSFSLYPFIIISSSNLASFCTSLILILSLSSFSSFSSYPTLSFFKSLIFFILCALVVFGIIKSSNVLI